MTGEVLSVNAAHAAIPDPHKPQQLTGIDKRPVEAIEVFDPGLRSAGGASGVRGDFIGDLRHHGGDDQAVYVVPREDLDLLEPLLGRRPGNGWMGENVTTTGLDADQAVVGETWRIGEAVVQVTCPRIPCGTFAGWAGRKGWLKDVTALGRLGTYVRVLQPGTIRAGQRVEVLDVPGHGVTIQEFFWAMTIRRELAGHVLDAGEYLPERDARRLAERAAKQG